VLGRWGGRLSPNTTPGKCFYKAKKCSSVFGVLFFGIDVSDILRRICISAQYRMIWLNFCQGVLCLCRLSVTGKWRSAVVVVLIAAGSLKEIQILMHKVTGPIHIKCFLLEDRLLASKSPIVVPRPSIETVCSHGTRPVPVYSRNNTTIQILYTDFYSTVLHVWTVYFISH